MANKHEKKELLRLVSHKTQICAQLDRFHDFIADVNEFTSKSIIQSRFDKCEDLWDKFDAVQSNIEFLEPSDGSERLVFEEKYFETIASFQELLKKPVVESNIISNPINNINNVQQSFAKLPALDLPTFNGNYDSWLGFYDSFVALIHNNNALGAVQKFYYLKSCLKDEAALVIHSIEVNDTNYNVAFQLLKDRYENKKFIIHSHVKALFELPVVGKNVLGDLRSLADNIQKNLRALKSLKEPVESWDTLLLYMFSNKLDIHSMREWETFCVKQSKVTCVDFFNFINERCHILENLESHKKCLNQGSVNQGSVASSSHYHNKVGVFNGSKGSHRDTRSFVTTERCAGNSTVNKQDNNCPICKASRHLIFRCPKFLSFNVHERINEIKRLHLCLNCFKNNHISTRCSFKGCERCGKPHNTLLHIDFSKCESENNDFRKEKVNNDSVDNKSEIETKTVPQSETVNTHSHNSVEFNESEVLLSTAEVLVVDNTGATHKVRALLDSGSQSSFISSKLVNKLNLETSEVNMSIMGINTSITKANKVVKICIKSKFNEFSVQLKFIVLNKITNNLPMIAINKNKLKIPTNINLADTNFHIPAKIDMLLGANIFYELLMSGQIRTEENMPLLQKTRLGWIISGSVPSHHNDKNKSVFSVNSKQSVCGFSSQLNIDMQMEKFWKLEEVEVRKILSTEERECEELFMHTTSHGDDGRFIVQLPTKGDINNIGVSKEIAEKRFLKLEKKLNSNNNLKTEYSSFLKEYEELGHMTEIPNNEIKCLEPIYYMPHHGIIKQDSTTTKLRVVFDASAKTNRGVSLNELLKTGPTIQDDLYSILIRFRKHNVVLSSDVAKMYRQVWVNPSQRNLQRILWRNNPNEDIKHYRLNTLTYGTTSASYLAIRCLHEAAKEQKENYPKACLEIFQNFYVDDLLTGGSTVEEVIQLKKEISDILERCGFKLRKWASNRKEIFKNEEMDKINQYIIDKDVTKTLGLTWNIKQDSLQYVISLDYPIKVTKRNILSILSRVFDPLGLVGPIIICAKMIMQEIWKGKFNWDEELPANIHKLWRQFYEDLPCLNNLIIPRHAIGQYPIEIHGYCDSSEKAYGACLIVRSVSSNNEVYTHILCAKSRVAPTKTITLPRLELCGALLLSRLVTKTIHALNMEISEIICWTDSTIVLAWLASDPSKWNSFVSHRVAEIQENKLINTWNHVSSEENPADLISRGCGVNNLIKSKIWWQGPAWLKGDRAGWPKTQSSKVSMQDLPEMRNVRTTLHGLIEGGNLISTFSSFLRLQRVTALCIRFYNNLRRKTDNRLTGNLTIKELENAFLVLCKIAQSSDFSEEIKALQDNKSISRSSKLVSLNPFLDKNNVLRVGGRIGKASISYDQRFPIILENNYFSNLIINYEHRRNLHMGAQNLLGIIRYKYWILGGISVIKRVLRKCIICFKVNPSNINPLMGELPEQRITPTRAFYNCGVDYAGPFNIRSSTLRNSKILKAYLCVFVCFVTRAIHLEVVSDLSTNSFLNSLKRFIGRRGKCKVIYSDCGTNFIGANNEMRGFLNQIQNNKFNNEIINYLSQDGINWKFIPPKSPHFGGLWEASVRQAKYHLKRIVGNAALTFEELTTVFVQIEACLNSRPLSAISNDPNDLSPLTPGHFLIGDSLVALPEPDVRSLNINRLNRYQYLKQIVQNFWSRWQNECLSEMIRRSKWKYSKGPPIKVGDLVLMKEDNLPPLKWSLGRVLELFPGADNITRVVLVKTDHGNFKRAVAKLCVLPLD